MGNELKYSFLCDVFGLHNWKKYKKIDKFYNAAYKPNISFGLDFKIVPHDVKADHIERKEMKIRYCRRCGKNQIDILGWCDLELSENEKNDFFQIERDRKLSKLLKK